MGGEMVDRMASRWDGAMGLRWGFRCLRVGAAVVSMGVLGGVFGVDVISISWVKVVIFVGGYRIRW